MQEKRDTGSIPGLGRFPKQEMTVHSSILAWKIPWTEEPDGLQSMGLKRVRHDWAQRACIHTHTHTHTHTQRHTHTLRWIIWKYISSLLSRLLYKKGMSITSMGFQTFIIFILSSLQWLILSLRYHLLVIFAYFSVFLFLYILKICMLQDLHCLVCHFI